MRVKLGVIALLASALAGSAQAQLVIGFHTGPFAGAGGSITYAGGSTPLVGANIPVQLLTSAGTPANASAFLLTGFGSGQTVHANVDFTTGNFTSYSNGIYTFAGGGTFTITGGVPAIPLPDGTALVTGSALSATFDSSLGILNLVLVNGTDHKDPGLLTFFGLPTDTVFKFSGTIHNFFMTGGGGDAFTAQASGSTDIENRLQTLSLACAGGTGQAGVPYNSSLVASGGLGPYTYAITSGSLPTGLTLNPTTGAITGTPTAVGTYTFNAQVTDSSGTTSNTATSSCTIVITPPQPLTIQCATATGQVGVAYSSSLVANGGVPPYTFSITSGLLPAGLTLNPSTGAITGTPTAAGTFNFTAQVADSTNSLTGTKTTNCTIVIAPAPLKLQCAGSTGQVGVPYNSALVATGGTGPYTYSITLGSLPAGLTLNTSTGAITGTPTSAGTSSFTAQVMDSSGNVATNTATSSCGITIAPAPLSVACATSTGKVGTPYSSAFVAAGGTPPYTYAITAGSLPPGLTLNTSSGALTGTPTTAGTFNFTVTVTDSKGDAATAASSNCSIVITPPTIAVTCITATGTVGTPYSSAFVASGGTSPYTYAITAGSLPAGLNLNPTTGAVTGTPTTAGTFNFTVTATDATAGQAATVSSNCSVTINPPVSATCVVINAVQGVPITPVTMTATGGSGTGYTFSATGLPTGLTMSAGGTISGTPTVSGTFPYTVTVTDSEGNKGTFNCSVTVVPPVSATCVVINAVQGVPITPVTMTATGGTGTGYTFSATGLPTGLSMSAGGTISGTPTVTGTFPYTVTVTDSAGNKGTFECSVTVVPPVSATCVVINAVQGVPITPVTMTATGGTGTGYTFSATGLPAGLSMSAGGTISGTPTVTGTFPYTVTVTDSAGNKGTFNCSVTVVPPVSATCVVINAVQGVPITPGTMTASGGTGTGYTFSATGLPAGLTMSAGGTISGTPTVSGTFPYTVTVTDSAGNKGTFECSVTVVPPVSATCVVINAVQGVPITPVTMTATGGTGTGYTFSATGLPSGLSMSAGGTISGTPTVSGTFPYTVTVTDSAGNKGTFNCSVTVAPPVSATCVVINAIQGVPITPVTMTASGGTGTGYTFSATGLPSGLSMSAGGTISGTPTVSGTFPYTVTVTDSAGNKGTFECSVTVIPPVSATCVVINAVQGVPITPVTMTATGGTGTGYTFSATGLPSGLSMSAGGTISGTPTVSGTFPYTVTVTDSAGNKGTFNCSVTVGPPVSATCVVISAIQGVPITPVTMTATGGTGTGYTFSATGLPSGLSMSVGGTISGTPTVSGTFPYTVTVTDSAGNKGTFNCSVTVGPPVSATCVVISAIQGVPITPVTMTATGGTGTGYTFSATGLPSGLSMSAGGTISGTPTVSGTFPYTVTVTDSAGNKGTFNCSVTVGPPVSATCVVITAIQGVAITPVTMTASGGTGTGYTFSATGLPSGLTMSVGGTISGTPIVSGTFPYTVTVTDSAGNKGTFNCSVTVGPPPSASCVAINAIQNVAITPVTMVGSGGAGGAYTFSATGLPTGLTMSSTGTISGTPTVSGTFNYTVTVTDKNGNKGTVNCSVTVQPPTTPPPPVDLQCGTCSSNQAKLGYSYSSKLTVNGGTAPFKFALQAGSTLPPGLTLDVNTGIISGTPTQAGTFIFTTVVTDAAGQTDTATCTIVVVGPPIDISCGTCGASKAIVGTLYSATVKVTGATAPLTFSVIYGSLPPGITLNTSTGVLSGTPTTAGSYSFKIKVVDANGSTDTTFCSLTVITSPVNLDCGVCGSGKAYVGKAFSETLVATGGTKPYTYSIVSGSLPPGLTLNPSTGVVSGTPTTAGSYTFTAKAVDASGYSDTASCTLDVSYTPVNLDCGACGTSNGKVGTAYSAMLAISGGKAPFTYSISSGSLPPGLTLNSSTGLISGTPTTAGSYTFTSKVVDANGSSDTATCTIVIAGSTINVDCGLCGGAKPTVGVAFSATLSLTGGTGPYTFSIYSGSLPAGLTLNKTTGVVSGTPTTAGTYTFVAKVVDSKGASDTTASCTITVLPSPMNLDCGSCGTGNASVGTAYNSNLSVTGASGSVTFSIISGSLPPGLTLNASTGAISGTPTTAGTYTFTSKAVDSKGSDTQSCTIIVLATAIDLQCGSCGAAKGVAGTAYSSTLKVVGGTPSFTFSIVSGSLPTGLTLSTSTGTISGTPTKAGSYTFTSKVVDSKGKSDTVVCTIVMVAPVDLQCGACGSSTVYTGTAYSSSLVVKGGSSPFAYSITSGSLPTGLTLNATTGAITGTPTTPGTYTFTSKVVDSSGLTDTVTCTIIVKGTIKCGDYITYTQGGWGASPSGNNPGTLLANNFLKVYSTGSVSIGGTYKLKFTSASAIAAFLPQGTTAGVLGANATNPTTSAAGVLAGQVLALQLSVDFSNKGITRSGLASLRVASGPLAGQTVAQVLALANQVLGGTTSALPGGLTISGLNSIIDAINNNFDGGNSNDNYLW